MAFVGTAVLLGLLVALATWGGFEVYEGVTDGDGVGSLDHPALDLAQDVRTPG
ncbi:hypothetical protein [Ornithinicoccus hortensis]|uniref:Uncharacterized protein n=1 Tax=Ornithinicoccus hortensis TaxID=82346 RepID=A0A542YVC0_9MICO|nr:hypothetical protein [Ornithinicoccus hortensis]TQL52031.1 hypothetical protein FB467_3199 [Ornithinicoccus hortensis]